MVAQRIQLGIEYDPQPPHQSGSPATASPETVAWFTAAGRFAEAAGEPPGQCYGSASTARALAARTASFSAARSNAP